MLSLRGVEPHCDSLARIPATLISAPELSLFSQAATFAKSPGGNLIATVLSLKRYLEHVVRRLGCDRHDLDLIRGLKAVPVALRHY